MNFTEKEWKQKYKEYLKSRTKKDREAFPPMSFEEFKNIPKFWKKTKGDSGEVL